MAPREGRDGNGGEEGAGTGPTRRAWLLALAGLVAVQLVLSLTAFHPAPHTGGDNAGYLTLAYSLVERGAYLDLWDPALSPHTKYPPIYPAVLAAAMLLGARAWVTFKLVSLLATTATVALVFLWARERRASLAFATSVAVLVAVSDAVLWGSRWILSDPLFVAFTFLALWAFARVERRAGEGGAVGGGDGDGRDGRDGRAAGREVPGAAAGPLVPWLVAGAAATVLAYFTRSAGLPLVVAVGAWMLLRRRWVALGAFAAGFGLPALLWWLRGRAVAGEAYVSEFWMVNPYRPELGTAGVGDLAGRVLQNLQLYVGTFFPQGVAGDAAPVLPFIGVVLTLLAVVGWGRRTWRGPGVAELFAFLYLGLILLWPQVWSSDRFALPLFPLLLFYAGEATVDGARRLHPRAPLAAGIVAVALLALPALATWRGTLAEARSCRLAAGSGNVWGCYAQGVRQFVAAARWSGLNLPEGAAVLSRKPRIFYVTSGLPSRTYPFVPETGALLAEAEATGSRYVVLDLLGPQAGRYLAPAIRDQPGAFCSVAGFGEAGRARTELLGILPPETRSEGAAGEEEAVSIRVCPPTMTRAEPVAEPEGPSGAVPLLRALDR